MRKLSRDVPRVQDEQDLKRNARSENWTSGWRDLVIAGFMPDGAFAAMTNERAFNICLEMTFEVRRIVQEHNTNA